MAAGEFDRSGLNNSTKVLIVESWVHHFLNTKPGVQDLSKRLLSVAVQQSCSNVAAIFSCDSD
jgi:hypothetical protein